SSLRLFGVPRRLQLTGTRRGQRVVLSYQHTPHELAMQSLYASVLHPHGLTVDLTQPRPGLVLQVPGSDSEERWFLIEVRFGSRRTVIQSARAALADLLSYRREFTSALDPSVPYGLGVAWGTGLEPATDDEVILVTPDQLGTGVRQLLSGLTTC